MKTKKQKEEEVKKLKAELKALKAKSERMKSDFEKALATEIAAFKKSIVQRVVDQPKKTIAKLRAERKALYKVKK